MVVEAVEARQGCVVLKHSIQAAKPSLFLGLSP